MIYPQGFQFLRRASDSRIMQALLGLLLSLICIRAWSFSYQVDPSSFYSPSLIERHELSQYFIKAGFTSLSERSLTQSRLPFEGAYVAENWNQALLLKAGVKAPPHLDGQILQDKSLDLLVFHFSFQRTPYLLVALSISKNEFEKIVSPWRKSRSAPREVLFKTLWFPEAHASPMECSPQNHSLQALQPPSDFIANTEILNNIGRCGLEALQGLQSSAQETLNLLKNLTADPKALWNEMKDSYLELKNFALNFQSDLQNLFQALGSLSPEEKTQIACAMTGRLLVKAAQNIVTPGGFLKLLPSMTGKIKEITELLKPLKELEGRGISSGNKSYLIEEALTCVK